MSESERVARSTQRDAAVVQAAALWKSYHTGWGDVPVLRGVDLSVAPGELVAVMGPSGCGKTTLLNCLSGLDRPDKGTVVFEGKDLARSNDRVRTRLRAERMGFVFQSFNLVPVLPVLANVRLPLELAGAARSLAEKKAKLALAAVGLKGFEQRRPPELSGGEQQRVAIARALANDPAVVWADEPTGSLDSATGKRILDLFSSLNRERGTTFLVITHDPAVAAIAHRTVRMDQGLVVEGA
jgi:putative ABC transport system ATP-binding protein